MGRARVVLVRPSARWSAAFVAAVRRSRRLHGRWVKAPSTPAAYRAYVGRLRRTTHEGYLICLRDSDELVGVANISEIVRGALRSGYLGYYVFRQSRLDPSRQAARLPTRRLLAPLPQDPGPVARSRALGAPGRSSVIASTP